MRRRTHPARQALRLIGAAGLLAGIGFGLKIAGVQIAVIGVILAALILALAVAALLLRRR